MKIYVRCLLLAAGVMFFNPFGGFSQAIRKGTNVLLRIDGSKKFQQIDGIGVNANTRSWNGDDLKPALLRSIYRRSKYLNSIEQIVPKISS